jgi:hypothetical protein
MHPLSFFAASKGSDPVYGRIELSVMKDEDSIQISLILTNKNFLDTTNQMENK